MPSTDTWHPAWAGGSEQAGRATGPADQKETRVLCVGTAREPEAGAGPATDCRPCVARAGPKAKPTPQLLACLSLLFSRTAQ